MIRDGFEDINIPDNIDSAIEKGAEKANNNIKRRRNKKIIILTASILLISMIAIGSSDVMAFNIPVIDKIYKMMGYNNEYLAASEYCGESAESNGIKVTVDKVSASRNFVKLAIKIEAEDERFEDPTNLIHICADINGRSVGSGGVSGNIDNKTQVRVTTLVDDREFNPKSTVNLKILSDEYGIDEKLSFKVDFTETEKQNLRRSISTDDNKVRGSIEATNNGAMVIINRFDEILSEDHSWNLWLNIDGKLCRVSGGMYNEEKCYFLGDDILIDDIRNAENISLIVEQMSEKVLAERYMPEEEKKPYYENEKDLYRKTYLGLPTAEKDNIKYITEIPSLKGHKIYISNVERADGKVRVFIDGENKEDAFTVAKSVYFDYEDYFEYVNDGDHILDLYRGRSEIRETSTGYVVETLDDIRDDNIQVRFGNILLKDDTTYKEIKLNMK